MPIRYSTPREALSRGIVIMFGQNSATFVSTHPWVTYTYINSNFIAIRKIHINLVLHFIHVRLSHVIQTMLLWHNVIWPSLLYQWLNHGPFLFLISYLSHSFANPEPPSSSSRPIQWTFPANRVCHAPLNPVTGGE